MAKHLIFPICFVKGRHFTFFKHSELVSSDKTVFLCINATQVSRILINITIFFARAQLQNSVNIGIIHVFHALTFAGPQRSCLNMRPLGRVLKLRPRDLASVNAMKQTCVIVIFAYSTWFQHKPRWTLNIHFLTLDFSKRNGISVKLSNVITSPQRHIYACNAFANENIGEMIRQGPNALQCNIMHANQGSV